MSVDLMPAAETLRTRDGIAVTLRFARPDDRDALQDYIRGLSIRSRHDRLLGAASELPAAELERFVHSGDGDRHTVLVLATVEGSERIIGEVRYVRDAAANEVEFGISLDDHWQGHGLGAALLANLECRAAALGAVRLLGDTLRTNSAMTALARKAGYRFVASPGDWRLLRFEKPISPAPEAIPCAPWRRLAEARGASWLADL